MDPDQTGQSDLGPHCLQNDFKNHKQMKKQTIIVVIGSLRVKCIFFQFFGDKSGLKSNGPNF